MRLDRPPDRGVIAFTVEDFLDRPVLWPVGRRVDAVDLPAQVNGLPIAVGIGPGHHDAVQARASPAAPIDWQQGSYRVPMM